MQSLWSRAGQASRCGCRACETAVSTLGRRVTTITRPRKPTFAEVFTAAYSSVFATAAVVDAIRKEDRRQDLDRQLDETRREVAELKLLQAVELERIAPTFDEDQPQLTHEQENELWDTLKDIYINRPFMKEIHKPVTLRISELLDRLQTDHYHCPDDATLRVLRKIDYEQLERAIISEESSATVRRRSPQTRKQLHNDSRTVVHLVQQLLNRADAKAKSSAPSPTFEEARNLATNSSPTYTFDSIDPTQAMQNRRALNKQLREVINSPTLGLKEMVGRVCYNLLVSAHPPDMHTYNTLIVAFDKLGHKSLAESVVNSFFYYRRLRPTPSTFVAILNHYKASNNHGKFLRALACITGLDNTTGAKVGRRHAEEVDMNLTPNRWAKGVTSTRTGDWIWKHVPLDQPLVEAILGGLLHFKLFDQAATFFVSCMKAEVPLSNRITRLLFAECISALDWRATVRLIQGFTVCKDSWPTMLLNHEEGVSYLISRIHVLLDICGLRAPDMAISKSTLINLDISAAKFMQFVEMLHRLDSTTQVDLHSSVTSLSQVDEATGSAMSRILQIESMWKEQALVGRNLRSIESKLLYPDFSTKFRASMAMHIGLQATEESRKLNREFMDLFASKRDFPGMEKLLRGCEAFDVDILTQSFDDFNLASEASQPTEEQAVIKEGSGRAEVGTESQVQASVRQQDQIALQPANRARSSVRRLKPRPEGLLTWTVPAQRPAMASQGQWIGFG